MKPKIQFFNPGEQAELKAAGILRKKLGDLLHNRDFWVGAALLIRLLFLFVTRIELAIPRYKMGDIAQSTVRASRDIQVPDTVSTERKRKEAQERVLPVYDYQPGFANSSVSRLHEVFTYLRTVGTGKPSFK